MFKTLLTRFVFASEFRKRFNGKMNRSASKQYAFCYETLCKSSKKTEQEKKRK